MTTPQILRIDDERDIYAANQRGWKTLEIFLRKEA